MTPQARFGDEATVATIGMAQTHGGKALLTRVIHHPSGPPCLAAQIKAVQRRPTTGLKIRLIPHKPKIRRIMNERKGPYVAGGIDSLSAAPAHAPARMKRDAHKQGPYGTDCFATTQLSSGGQKDWQMDTDEPQIAANDLKVAVEHYQHIAGTALADVHAWLRQGALSAAILEAMPDAILVVDSQGSIVSANCQFELMFGYPRSEVIGRTPEMLLPDEVRISHAQQRRAYFDNPRVRDMAASTILRGRRKNGTEIQLLIKLGPVVVPYGVYTIVCIRRTKE